LISERGIDLEPNAWWQPLSGIVVGVHRQAQLLEVVSAAAPSPRLACRLHCGQKQPDEHADDGDHHKQFDERETVTVHGSS
jgi:hypothetical protein